MARPLARTLAATAAAGTVLAVTPAGPSVGSPDPERVGPSEFHAVRHGMSAPHLDRVLHGASYRTSGPVGCRTRTYRGWDRQEHFRVLVTLEEHAVVQKSALARNETVLYICD